MADPQTAEEFEARFTQNEKVSGYGMFVTVHLPCPFCAAAEFMVHRVVDVEASMRKGAVCRECGRGARAIFKKSFSGNMTTIQIVQTVGDDPPSFVKMSRENKKTTPKN